MPITPGEQNAILSLIASVNTQMNIIISAREDVLALLRIAGDINNDTAEDAVLNQAKIRGKTAAQAIVTLLS